MRRANGSGLVTGAGLLMKANQRFLAKINHPEDG